MRCPNCGSETVEKAAFCERCGQRLFSPSIYAPPVTYQEPVRKSLAAWVKFLPFLGLIIIGLGALLYGLAISNIFHTASDPSWDPYGTGDNLATDVRILLASYAVMIFGGVVLLASFIVLVVKSE
jgi:multisubunit Na+/H+ antiporter MnhB subunit